MSKLPSRHGYLDSVRGLAALVVVTAHFLAFFLPYSIFGSAEGFSQRYSWESLILTPPFSALTSAHFAVCLFFVLSGFVLTLSFVGQAGKGKNLLVAMIKRPVRLGGVMVFSICCGATLMAVDGFSHTELGLLTGSGQWLSSFWTSEIYAHRFVVDLLTAKAGSEYNPPLWTIKIELLGSMMVFALLIVLNYARYILRTAALIIIYFLLIGTYYEAFVFGLLAADALKHTRLGAKKLSGRTSLILGAVAFLLASFPYYFVRESVLLGAELNSGYVAVLLYLPMITAQCVFLLVVMSPSIQHLLGGRWLHFLGDKSYSVYASHFLILGTVSSATFLSLHDVIGYGVSLFVTAILTAVVVMAVSVYMHRYIDMPATRAATAIGKKLDSLSFLLLKAPRFSAN